MLSETLQVGLDLGSTTAKLIVLDDERNIVFSVYRRHASDIKNTLSSIFKEASDALGSQKVRLAVTGSAGMGLAERFGVPFVQEVISAGEITRQFFPEVKTLIDIGGEDSKMIFFSYDRPPDIRMNGSCAGGTGAFIDQMAALLGISLKDLNSLSLSHSTIHPIASRCGVFAKTDVQNLVSRKIDIKDICASILHGVAVQNINSLARGIEIKSKVLFCGGPLMFCTGLQKRFIDCLKISPDDVIVPKNGLFLPAWGAALQINNNLKPATMEKWLERIIQDKNTIDTPKGRLPSLFEGDDAYNEWEAKRPLMRLNTVLLQKAAIPLFLGIDSGSTTTKVIVIDSNENIIFSDYRHNIAMPVNAAAGALNKFKEKSIDIKIDGKSPEICASATTGYGEDLIRAALGLDIGVVETLAHFKAATKCDPDVSFILDIGGQDMKAIFVENSEISRIEINEACSSGCGSFIEGFANSLGLEADQFAKRACKSVAPCDLGTRCTVFMNSRIKQAQRENAKIEDIAAGLAYSVIKNSLYKVLKLRSISELGQNIVVQGGTFRNHAVLRAFEKLAKCRISCSDMPEMMGAYGAAIIAKERFQLNPEKFNTFKLSYIEALTSVRSSQTHCNGCTNRCQVTIFVFGNNRKFYTGNKCERFFSNKGEKTAPGQNLFAERNVLLFNSQPKKSDKKADIIKIGIPRILVMYEEFPFWNTLFTESGFDVVLSAESTQTLYEKGVGTIMGDNICFPAKLAHGHIADLIEKRVDRIFYPIVIHEKIEEDDAANSFNCPIAAAYAEVLEALPGIKKAGQPVFDLPPISFRDQKLLKKGCYSYMKRLEVSAAVFNKAFDKALQNQKLFQDKMYLAGKRLIEDALENKSLLVVLAGRPYHSDPLIEHRTSQILSNLGVNIIPADVAARFAKGNIKDINTIPQWTFPNRLFKSAMWVAEQKNNNIQYVMLNSFGCGPDAFIMDEIKDILSDAGKIFTLIKIDEIFSGGSAALRLRSLVETMSKPHRVKALNYTKKVRKTTPPYKDKDKSKKIIIPYFAEPYSPFLKPILKLSGYDLDVLPISDQASLEYGLKYANNEICYPATIVIGDIIKAFKTRSYAPDRTAVGMTQTGGQCRASNYISIIKKGLIRAGYFDVPVISFAYGDSLTNDQPGFTLKVEKIIKPAFASILFADAVSSMYYKTVVRENSPGAAFSIMDNYLKKGALYSEKNDTKGLIDLLKKCVNDFNDIVSTKASLPKIGIVGEIFLKYNQFSQMNTINWLISKGIEPVIPCLADFILQIFVNEKVNRQMHITRPSLPIIVEAVYKYRASLWISRFEKVMKNFVFYEQPITIYKKAELASKIVSLANQFGEGWLIPAEVANFADHGIFDIVCLQPFGCIANQVVAKGIEKKIKNLYPKVNMLFLDFDAGTSEVNILNRLHFMVQSALYNHQKNR